MAKHAFITEKNSSGVVTLTFNRPEIHNAFDDVLIADLTATLQQLNTDEQIRIVVLAANGKSFSAGADLNWMQRIAKYSMPENLADANKLALLTKTLYQLNKPTIALVQGPSYGGGVGLVACCDIAIASEKASFCFSETKIGLIPAVISPYIIKAIGQRAAQRYFLSAECFSAAEALRLGLIHEVVAEQDLNAAGQRMISQLLNNSPAAIAAAKELIFAVSEKNIDDALIADTAKRIALLRNSLEGQEGLNAFLSKRKPNWIQEEDPCLKKS